MIEPMVSIYVSKAELQAMSRLVMYARAIASTISKDEEMATKLKVAAQAVEDILARPRYAEGPSHSFVRAWEENKPK